MPAPVHPNGPAPRGRIDEVGVMTFRPKPLPTKPTANPAASWRSAGKEPRLSEVLNDPIVHQVMRRDGVSFAELAAVIAQAQATLWRGLCCDCAA